MDTVTFSIPSFNGAGETGDLGNAVNSLNGVADVTMDPRGRTVSVMYDPRFASRKTIETAITHAGYPIVGGVGG